MIQWEYIEITRSGMFDNKWEGEKISLVDFLNKMGKQGWESKDGNSFKPPLTYILHASSNVL